MVHPRAKVTIDSLLEVAYKKLIGTKMNQWLLVLENCNFSSLQSLWKVLEFCSFSLLWTLHTTLERWTLLIKQSFSVLLSLIASVRHFNTAHQTKWSCVTAWSHNIFWSLP